MALYFYFNETTGDLVYSDQATYSGEGYTSLGEQTDMSPNHISDYIFDSYRSKILSVTKDESVTKKITGLKQMMCMFEYCYSLTNADLSGFDTSQVTNMSYMLHSCSKLTDLDLSGFDTSQVTNMSYMLDGCIKLTDLDLSGFDTSKVTHMNEMFWNCSSLINLDLSSFNTSKVVNMEDLFYKNTSLTSLDISNFDTSNLSNSYGVFNYCSNLRIISISNNMSNILSSLPSSQYYPAAGGDPVAKKDLVAGTWIRDESDMSIVTSIVEQAQMSQAISRRISKMNLLLRSKINELSSAMPNPTVDIVKVSEHSTSYTRDTLEVIVDSTGKVTDMYFVSA